MLKNPQKFTSLRIKTITALLLLFLFLVFIIYMVIGSVSKKQILEIENRDVTQKVSMAIDALEGYGASLATSVADWGPWDEAYQFAEDGNEKFITNNLQPVTLLNFNLDMIAFVNRSCGYTFAKAFDRQTEEFRPFPTELTGIFEKSKILNNTDPKTVIQGIAALPEGPMLIASYPILTSTFEGPVRGQVVMGRYIDEEMVREISARLKMTVNLEGVNQEVLKSPENMGPDNPQHPTEITIISGEKVAGRRVVNDMFGQPVLQLGIETNRDYNTIGSSGLVTTPIWPIMII